MVLQLELGSILSIQKFGMVHESLPVEKSILCFLYMQNQTHIICHPPNVSVDATCSENTKYCLLVYFQVQSMY